MFNSHSAAPDDYKKSYLIQALSPPQKHWGGGIGPFDFGGGGSGLSKAAGELLSKLFSFTYMGAAEYEFGACADGFRMIQEFRKSGSLVAQVMEVEGQVAEKEIEGSPWYAHGKALVTTSVYVIACKNHLPKIKESIESLLTGRTIKGEYGDSVVKLKTGIKLWDALFSPEHYWGEPLRKFVGGIELDNGWMVFTDYDIFVKTCELWDLEAPAKGTVVHTPPMMLRSNQDVDRGLTDIVRGLGKPIALLDLFNAIYECDYKVGDTTLKEHVAMVHQVERRLAILTNKKIISRDRKTKLYNFTKL